MKTDDEEVDLKKANDDVGWTLVTPGGENYYFLNFLIFLLILDKFSFRGKINRIFDGNKMAKATDSTAKKGPGKLAKNDSEILTKKKRRG